MATTPSMDTKGKPVPAEAIKQHKAMAMGKTADTGAGSGAKIVASKPSTKW
jgi:hypothetical protein